MEELKPKAQLSWKNVAAWLLLTLVVAGVAWVGTSLLSDGNRSESARWMATLAATVVIIAFIRIFSSWRIFKRAAVVLACFAAIILLVHVEEDLRGWLAWRHFRSQWEARGEKFDYLALTPPPVPDDQNFAMAPVVFTSYGWVLDKNGNHRSDTNVVNRMQMPVELDGGGPTNGVGNWQKGIRSDLSAWQAYYWRLAHPTNDVSDKMAAAFRARYGLTSKPPKPDLFLVPTVPKQAADDVRLALSIYDQTVEELRAADLLPGTRFPLNYGSNPGETLLPHLAALKSCSMVLRLRALAELQQRKPEEALNDVVLALHLTDKVRSEPFLISHLVRIAMLQITEQAIWEGMVSHAWDDAQLARLSQGLAKLDFVGDYMSALRGENACFVGSLEYFRHHRSKLSEIMQFNDQGVQPGPQLSLGILFPSGWFYQNERGGAQFLLENYIPIVDPEKQTWSPAQAQAAERKLSEMRTTPYTFSCKLMMPAVAKAAKKFALAQASVNLSATASALERYRLANGKYPETLAEVSPKFLAKVPGDPVGRELLYRKTDDGNYLLYSLGWNTQDDGGAVALTKGGSVDADNGDWVWGFPK